MTLPTHVFIGLVLLGLPFCNGSMACLDLLRKMGDISGEFVQCTLNYARPILYCQMCVDQYIRFRRIRSLITTTLDENGQPCEKLLLEEDRGYVIDHTTRFIEKRWANWHCDDCFINSPEEDAQKNSTKEFMNVVAIATTCMDMYDDGFAYIHGRTPACDECRDLYENVTNLYNGLRDGRSSECICLDIVDAMNVTRSRWSKNLGCVSWNASTLISYIGIGTVIAGSIGFYAVMYFATIHQANSRRRRLLRGYVSPYAPINDDIVVA